MIPQSVIDNLGLVLSSNEIGYSALNKATVMEWPQSVKDHKVYIADCDLEGKLLKGTLLIIIKGKKQNGYCTVSTELLADKNFEIRSYVFPQLEIIK